MAKIQYSTPEGSTGEIELTAERMTIGRADDNNIVIGHDSVSSHHGEIGIEGDAWVLTDLGSTNGTKINGERVERVELSHGGAFTLGHVECVFVGDYEEPAPAYTPAPARSMSVTGYSATAIDAGRRSGFGPKAKPKSGGYAGLYALAVIALLVCAFAIFQFTQMKV